MKNLWQNFFLLFNYYQILYSIILMYFFFFYYYYYYFFITELFAFYFNYVYILFSFYSNISYFSFWIIHIAKVFIFYFKGQSCVTSSEIVKIETPMTLIFNVTIVTFCFVTSPYFYKLKYFFKVCRLSLIHIWRCRRYSLCRSRWSPYH